MKYPMLGIALILTISITFLSTVSYSSSSFSSPANKKTTTKPNIQHGVTYQPVANIEQYFVSEKLDGIRGYWDGKNLITRQGNKIYSPEWFTQYWPKQPLDGELWIGRNQFEAVLSCVSKKAPEQNQAISCWKDIRFMIFDLPSHTGTFSDRVNKMQALLVEIRSPYFAMINQVKFNNIKAVEEKLAHIISMQGEGLMLHLASSYYKTGRNKALMKFKKHQDAEATVIGYSQGTGKYRNHLGALKVKTKEGIIFKIGSGFTDEQRANPPAIGSLISFKYNGLTKSGIPKFARFWRLKSPQ